MQMDDQVTQRHNCCSRDLDIHRDDVFDHYTDCTESTHSPSMEETDELDSCDVEEYAQVTTPNSVDVVINHLKDCAENQVGFDIHQFAAFRHTANTNPRKKYYLAALKASLALCTQLFAMTVILATWMLPEFQSIYQDPGHYLQRHPYKPIEVRLLSILLLFVIVVFSVQQFNTFSRLGMYRINPRDLRNKPDFVNSWWITIGRYTNITVLFMVMLGSMFLNFSEVDPILIVLKSSALFFVLKLDDLFCIVGDYKDIADFLNRRKEYQDVRSTPRRPHMISERGRRIHSTCWTVSLVLFRMAVASTALFVVAILAAGGDKSKDHESRFGSGW